jgi:hypothetical protein
MRLWLGCLPPRPIFKSKLCSVA